MPVQFKPLQAPLYIVKSGYAEAQILGVSSAFLQMVERMVQIEPLDFFLFIYFYLNFCILFYLNNT